MKYTRDVLEPIVAASTSIAQVLQALGIRPSGGNYCHIARRIDYFGIDRSHFFGRGANRGDRHRGGLPRKTWRDILVKRETGQRGKPYKLRRALIEMGREYRCEGLDCPIGSVWRGRPIILQVNHKNGDWLDDRPDNLEFLCPNCHSQTENWCGTKSLTGLTDRYLADRKR